jgi:puromycin-sensitive aminopeptidase
VGRAYRGEVAIDVLLEHPLRQIELHAADLRFYLATAQLDVSRVLPGRVVERKLHERIALRFEAPLPAGEITLRMRFRGALRDDLRGLYRVSAEGRQYAFTQLEAADARRVFPCFDEPSFKARFTLCVTTDAAHRVLSNAPVASTRRDRNKRKVHHRFRTTPPLSTYLLALAVGPLEASRSVRLGETPIRVWHAPGKRKLTRFALEAAHASLERLERYFALPYPYEKLDLVAVPDFEAGAMENAGAVFFRETLLLLDPKTATPHERKRAAEVICHELAHMWYGDLVTMEWWDDLWLNEAFATWMAFQIVDDWKPEWKMWQDFQLHRAAALRLDALRNTHPIHTPVRTPEEATANFDLITYEKGASVVRMIERYLGASVFRKGVRRYIRRHREGNAVAADLWNALSEAAGEPVDAIVRPWIEQEGFPQLAIAKHGRQLHFEQTRFRAAPRRKRDRVATRRETIAWPANAKTGYGNADEGGFFRPLHDNAWFDEMLAEVERLDPVERMGLVDHEWAFARAGKTNLRRFLRLAEALAGETDPDVLIALRGPLASIVDPLAQRLGGRTPQRFQDRLVETFGPHFLEVTWSAARDEGPRERERRAALIDLLGLVAEWPAVEAAAEPRFEALLRSPRALDPHLVDAVVELAARHGDAARFDALLAASESGETPQTRRRFLFALASFRDERLVRRVQRLCLGARVPTQDVAFLLARLMANPAARISTWRFIRDQWKRISRRIPPMLATRLVEATPALGPAAAGEVRSFFRAHPLPAGARSLDQALERFQHDAAFCKRAAPALKSWLAEN